MGDVRLIGTKRCSGDPEAAASSGEGVEDGRAPAHDIAGMVDLVEDHKGALGGGSAGVQTWILSHLGIGDDAAVCVGGQPLGIGGVPQVEPERTRRQDPLGAQMVGRAHDDDAIDDVVLPQMGGHRQGECRLSGTRGGTHQPVGRVGGDVLIQCLALPGP